MCYEEGFLWSARLKDIHRGTQLQFIIEMTSLLDNYLQTFLHEFNAFLYMDLANIIY